MKQLRLISNTESQADFNVLFQEPILIKPNSTIGLQNFSLFFDDEMIEVNDDNNAFVMEFFDNDNADKIFGKFTLRNGTYNATEFVDELNYQMNKGLANISSTYLGQFQEDNYMEISCVLDKLTKNLSITYALEAKEITPSDITLQFIVSDGQNTFGKNVVSAFDWAFAYTDKISCEGQSSMTMRVSNTGGSVTGIAMGFINLLVLNQIATNMGQGLTPDLFYFCVFNDDGTFWKIKKPSGEIITSTQPVTNSDVLEISKGAYSSDLTDPTAFDTFGYRITVTKGVGGGSVTYNLAQIAYDYGQQLHGTFAIRDVTSQIINYGFTPSPSNVSNKYGSGIHIVKDFRLLEKNNYYSKNLGGDPEPPYNKLYLNLGENVAKLLGFTNPETNTITGATGAWDADISIYATVIPSSILVELPNTHVHSYDGDVYYKRRRNILSIIPSVNLEQENTKITYEPAFPVMLDMLNKNDELLTNVRVRILDLDNVPLRINSNKGCSLSVLIQ
jgi:hypothetical protein